MYWLAWCFSQVGCGSTKLYQVGKNLAKITSNLHKNRKDKRIFIHLDAFLADFSIDISVQIFTVAKDVVTA